MFNIIVTILLMLILISVSAAVIIFIGTEAKQQIPSQVQQTVERFVNILFAKSPYNFCEALSGKEISISDFHTLLQAVYNGQCGSTHANVTLSFSLSKEDIQKIARTLALANGGKLIYYNFTSPLGVGGIIIQGQPGYYPLKKWDTVEIWQEGEPQPDMMIKMVIKGCDPYDDVCDPLCTYKKICDPVCDDGQKHDVTCNLACIDVDGDGIINETDAQARIDAGKCNPDCYTNITNPFKAYDPGCVYKYHVKDGANSEMYDNICDPNSNGVIDGVCDPDCAKTKNICDPDCNGTFYSGNPFGINDKKCSTCDGNCDGWCSPKCEYVTDDPDCERNADSTFWCIGDQLCDNNRGENCGNSNDCKQICQDENFICCPSDKKSDYAGCTERKDLKEGDECGCDNQCGNLKCDETKHCCPANMKWNGTKCAEICRAGPYDRFACAFPDSYNFGLDVCKPVVRDFANRWILSNPSFVNQLNAGQYDNIVREIWRQSYSLNYNNRRYDPTVQACTGSSTTVSGLLDGSNYYGVCNHWAAVGTSLLRTLGIPKERVYNLGMMARGGGHAVTIYKSDNGDWWILDYTCCQRLFRAADWSSCGYCACASTNMCMLDNDYYSDGCPNDIRGIC